MLNTAAWDKTKDTKILSKSSLYLSFSLCAKVSNKGVDQMIMTVHMLMTTFWLKRWLEFDVVKFSWRKVLVAEAPVLLGTNSSHRVFCGWFVITIKDRKILVVPNNCSLYVQSIRIKDMLLRYQIICLYNHSNNCPLHSP